MKVLKRKDYFFFFLIIILIVVINLSLISKVYQNIEDREIQKLEIQETEQTIIELANILIEANDPRIIDESYDTIKIYEEKQEKLIKAEKNYEKTKNSKNKKGIEQKQLAEKELNRIQQEIKSLDADYQKSKDLVERLSDKHKEIYKEHKSEILNMYDQLYKSNFF